MIKTKVCKLCGKEYQTDQNASKYCSPKCSAHANAKNVQEAGVRFKARQAEINKKASQARFLSREMMNKEWLEYIKKVKADDVASGGSGIIRSEELRKMKFNFEKNWMQAHGND